jgi:hypothetical protein
MRKPWGSKTKVTQGAFHVKLITTDKEHLRCLPLNNAMQQLDTVWDNYFVYNANT